MSEVPHVVFSKSLGKGKGKGRVVCVDKITGF